MDFVDLNDPRLGLIPRRRGIDILSVEGASQPEIAEVGARSAHVVSRVCVAVALVRLNKSRPWKKFSGRSLVSID
jgi:hypothetical protein